MDSIFIEMKKLFIDFLEKAGVRNKFFTALITDISKKGLLGNIDRAIEGRLRMISPERYVEKAFNWYFTDDGEEFWGNINKKWHDCLKSHKIVEDEHCGPESTPCDTDEAMQLRLKIATIILQKTGKANIEAMKRVYDYVTSGK